MMQTAQHAVVLAGLGAIFFLLERFIPLRPRRATLLRRYMVNGAISGVALGAAILAVQPTATAMLAWASNGNTGLLQLLNAAPVLRSLVAFLLMDLSFYYWHRLNHRLPWLWRFHNVHHVDPDLDLSTAFRFHFGEIALSAGFRAVQILVIAPSLAEYALYELGFQANTLFHHSNVRLPIRVERALNGFLVTPRMHGIHHSQVLHENRSNYGVVFPWWDRIHRTLRLNVRQSEVVIGIAGYSAPQDNSVSSSFSMPFRRQRDYWSGPGEARPERDGRAIEPDVSSLAE
jgi:sterol desaturase/sphingolipid hydroxylase (fatty acid hydroxylase superfamily)